MIFYKNTATLKQEFWNRLLLLVTGLVFCSIICTPTALADDNLDVVSQRQLTARNATYSAVSLPKNSQRQSKYIEFNSEYDEFSDNQSQTGVEAVLERGYLRVGMPKNDNFPFYSEKQNGSELEGIDPEIARSLADIFDVDLEFIRNYNTHNEVIEAVARGEVDYGIAKFSRTPKRGSKVVFTQPYLMFREALLVNQKALVRYEARGQSIDDIFQSELTEGIAVLEGTSYVAFARQHFPNAKILEYPTWEEVVNAVLDGEALAAFRDEVEVRSIVINQPELAFQLKSILVADSNDSKGIAVSRENLLLKEVADLYLDSIGHAMGADKVLERISERQKNSSDELEALESI